MFRYFIKSFKRGYSNITLYVFCCSLLSVMQLIRVGFCLHYQYYLIRSRACLRSAMISSASSRPTERRTRPSLMPAAFSSSRCVGGVRHGKQHVRSMFQHRRDTARLHSLTLFITMAPSSLPPLSSKEIMPPGRRICF